MHSTRVNSSRLNSSRVCNAVPKLVYIGILCFKNILTVNGKNQIFFVLLGSLVSFMRDDVLGASAPLHGRANLELKMNPFDSCGGFQTPTFGQKMGMKLDVCKKCSFFKIFEKITFFQLGLRCSCAARFR